MDDDGEVEGGGVQGWDGLGRWLGARTMVAEEEETHRSAQQFNKNNTPQPTTPTKLRNECACGTKKLRTRSCAPNSPHFCSDDSNQSQHSTPNTKTVVALFTIQHPIFFQRGIIYPLY